MPRIPDPKLRQWWARVDCSYHAEHELVTLYRSRDMPARSAFLSLDAKPDRSKDI